MTVSIRKNQKVEGTHVVCGRAANHM